MKSAHRDSDEQPFWGETFGLKQTTDGGFWAYDPSFYEVFKKGGRLGEQFLFPFHIRLSNVGIGKPEDIAVERRDFDVPRLLQWLIQQFMLNHWSGWPEGGLPIKEFTIGFEANPVRAASVEAAKQKVEQRLHRVFSARMLATQLEEGVVRTKSSELEDVWKELQTRELFRSLVQWHYAFVLAEMLERLIKRLHELKAMPLFDAPDKLRKTISEATRCHLFGLDRACIALCGASLESALEEALKRKNLFDEVQAFMDRMKKTGKRPPGRFQAMIEVACNLRLLTEDEKNRAHEVRQKRNDCLHDEVNPEVAGEILRKTRRLIGAIGRNTV